MRAVVVLVAYGGVAFPVARGIVAMDAAPDPAVSLMVPPLILLLSLSYRDADFAWNPSHKHLLSKCSEPRHPGRGRRPQEFHLFRGEAVCLVHEVGEPRSRPAASARASRTGPALSS